MFGRAEVIGQTDMISLASYVTHRYGEDKEKKEI